MNTAEYLKQENAILALLRLLAWLKCHHQFVAFNELHYFICRQVEYDREQ